MYQYIFELSNGITDYMLGDTFNNVLYHYFQKRGSEILDGNSLVNIIITAYPKTDKDYTINKNIIDQIIKTLKQQNKSTEDQKLDTAIKCLKELEL